tara:strand:+ start:406 stop:537 length:132 start_codon:yes stop_codon:yes gene_type:complete
MGLIIGIIFAIVWIAIIYEFINAPTEDRFGNIIIKTKLDANKE